MLTQVQAEKWALLEQTTTDNILKEHYQMYLLELLFKSPFEDGLVFKGGTALRLAFKSVRFSEDLDFSLRREVRFSDFKKTIEAVTRIFPESKIKDLYDKHFTLYAQISFEVGFKPIPIGIKIEINKEARGFEETVMLLKSDFNNVEVMGRVYTLESILKDKMSILDTRSRRDPRDLFDAWLICQKLGERFEVKDEYKYEKRELMNGLNPLLPERQRKVIDLFVK